MEEENKTARSLSLARNAHNYICMQCASNGEMMFKIYIILLFSNVELNLCGPHLFAVLHHINFELIRSVSAVENRLTAIV